MEYDMISKEGGEIMKTRLSILLMMLVPIIASVLLMFFLFRLFGNSEAAIEKGFIGIFISSVMLLPILSGSYFSSRFTKIVALSLSAIYAILYFPGYAYPWDDTFPFLPTLGVIWSSALILVSALQLFGIQSIPSLIQKQRLRTHENSKK